MPDKSGGGLVSLRKLEKHFNVVASTLGEVAKAEAEAVASTAAPAPTGTADSSPERMS